MIALVALALLQGAAAPAPAPLVTWTVSPETVTVAEPFVVTVTVRAAPGTALEFPPGPDSSHTVEAVDPPALSAATDSSGAPLRRAAYRLVAWETGTQQVPLSAVTVGSGAATLRFALQPQVFVRSVLPADSALRVPRPALTVLPGVRAWWPYLLAALLIAAVAFWIRRQRRRRRASAPPPSALALALDAMARIEALGLLEAGEPSRYIGLHADVLRGYLGGRVQKVSRALTSAELLATLRGHGLPLDRIAAVLAEADQVQFARRGVSADRARDVAREVRALLDACEEHFAKSIPAPPTRAA